MVIGVYIPIIRIPIKGGMTIPNIGTFDHGTNVDFSASTTPWKLQRQKNPLKFYHPLKVQSSCFQASFFRV